jgi:hypothetical protein
MTGFSSFRKLSGKVLHIGGYRRLPESNRCFNSGTRDSVVVRPVEHGEVRHQDDLPIHGSVGAERLNVDGGTFNGHDPLLSTGTAEAGR